MGAIKTSIVLNDGMTAVLQKINRAMNLTIGTFETMQKTASMSVSTNQIAKMHGAMNEVNDVINEISRSYSECGRKQQELNDKISQGTSKAGGMLNKIKGIVSAYAGMQTVKTLVGLSDTQTQTSARLGLMAKNFGGTGSADEVTAMRSALFASAQRSRGDYQTTADAVSKLGLMAGSAFAGPQEIIDFTEQLNKKFKIAGTASAGIDAAMLQLTQAMGSGVLRGEEFNSVLDQASNIIQSIANYMDVPQGKLKDMAADGLITAQTVKNAILADAEETNAAFNSIPMTWADVWTSAKNRAVQALDPLLNKINELANSPEVTQTVDGIINAFSALTEVAGVAFEWICKIYSFISSNWSIISPIIYGIAAAMGVYLIATKGVAFAQTVATAVSGAFKAAQTFLSIGFGVLTGNTAAASAATFTYNSALLACPITWILLIIIAVVAAIYAVVGAVCKLTGSTISATGVIFGAIYAAAAAIWNTIVGLINGIIQFAWTYFVEPWLGIVEWVLNVCNGGFNSFGDAVKNLIGNIISWFLSLGKVVTKIIDAIFQTDWTGGLNSLQEKVLSWGKNEKAITLSRDAPTLQSLTGGFVHTFDYSTAYNKGYSFGSKVDEKISGLTEKLKMSDFDFGSMQNTVADISDSSGKTAKNTEKTKEELKYLRDIAERDAVNRFTTAEIKVDMTGMTNSISGKADIDGILSIFTDGLEEALLTAAEGVAR